MRSPGIRLAAGRRVPQWCGAEIPSGSIARAVEQARQKGERTVTAHIRWEGDWETKTLPLALRPAIVFVDVCRSEARILLHHPAEAPLYNPMRQDGSYPFSLSHRRRARPRRHGGRLSCERHAPRACGRDQDAHRGGHDRRGPHPQVRSRSALGIGAQPPQHRHDLRHRGGGRFHVHRDGARRRHHARSDAGRRPATGGQGPRSRHADRVGARGRARGRHRPSRHQAGQRHRHP